MVIVLFVFLDLQLMITPLVSFGHCVVCLLRFTAYDYPFGILDVRIRVTPLVSFNAFFVYTTNFHHTLLYPTELYDFDFGALWTI